MTKIIYLDIDGTLRDETTGVPACTQEALHACKAQGIYIVLCTGRNPASIQPDVRSLQTDGLIAGGGCCVRLRGKTLRSVYFAQRTAAAALHLAAQGGLGLSLESEQEIYMNKSAAQFYERDFAHKLLRSPQPERARQNNRILYQDNLGTLALSRTPVHKICLLGAQPAIDAAQRQLSGAARVVQRRKWNGSDYLELLPPGCDKGSAVRLVNRTLGIARADSLCFGDGENDMDMFDAAGIRVAVRGGYPALTRRADFLCGSPAEGGVAAELKRLGILRGGAEMPTAKGVQHHAAKMVAKGNRLSDLSQELL